MSITTYEDRYLLKVKQLAKTRDEVETLRATVAALTAERADLMAQLAACGNAEPPNSDGAAVTIEEHDYIGYLLTLSDGDRYNEVRKMSDAFCLECGSRYLPCYCTRDD